MKLLTLLYLVLSSSFVARASDSLSLYLFLLDDCIICQDYTPELNDLYETYGEEIDFVGYFPNFSSKQKKIDSFRVKYGIEFPLKSDYFKSQCAKYGATITPEVILYNHTTESVIYKGRIDNKFYKLGRRRNVVTKHELRDALEAVLNHKPVTFKETEAIGCYINYSDAISKYQLK